MIGTNTLASSPFGYISRLLTHFSTQSGDALLCATRPIERVLLSGLFLPSFISTVVQ
jgi:hypothetical protein